MTIETNVIIKMRIDKLLFALLGRHELVDQWWESPNLFFGLKTPYDVYQTNEAGRQAVLSYVENAAYGGGGS